MYTFSIRWWWYCCCALSCRHRCVCRWCRYCCDFVVLAKFALANDDDGDGGTHIVQVPSIHYIAKLCWGCASDGEIPPSGAPATIRECWQPHEPCQLVDWCEHKRVIVYTFLPVYLYILLHVSCVLCYRLANKILSGVYTAECVPSIEWAARLSHYMLWAHSTIGTSVR